MGSEGKGPWPGSDQATSPHRPRSGRIPWSWKTGRTFPVAGALTGARRPRRWVGRTTAGHGWSRAHHRPRRSSSVLVLCPRTSESFGPLSISAGCGTGQASTRTTAASLHDRGLAPKSGCILLPVGPWRVLAKAEPRWLHDRGLASKSGCTLLPVGPWRVLACTGVSWVCIPPLLTFAQQTARSRSFVLPSPLATLADNGTPGARSPPQSAIGEITEASRSVQASELSNGLSMSMLSSAGFQRFQR